MLGTGTYLDGLACTQTGPASLQVQVAPGAIYTQVATDTTSYGSVGTNSNLIMKQGLSLATTTLTLAAPTSTGQSINYLVQASYSDVDANPTVLSYFNSANPTVPFVGPGNTGASQPTTRKGVCVISLKAGTPAATGSQVTPSPDSGYVGLYVITVAYGQTTITNGQITTLASAPFITRKLGTPVPATPRLYGLTLSNDAGSPNTVLDIAAGGAIDSTGAVLMRLASATTKTFASFAPGGGAGGLDAGTVASSTWYHVHLIYNPTTGLTDVLFSLSYATPALPSGYTYAVPIGAVLINGSGNIWTFKQVGNQFFPATGFTDFNSTTAVAGSWQAITHSVPAGVRVRVFGHLFLNGASSTSNISLSAYDECPYINANATYGANVEDDFLVLTNLSGQTKLYGNYTGIPVYIETHGFFYPRGIQ